MFATGVTILRCAYLCCPVGLVLDRVYYRGVVSEAPFTGLEAMLVLLGAGVGMVAAAWSTERWQRCSSEQLKALVAAARSGSALQCWQVSFSTVSARVPRIPEVMAIRRGIVVVEPRQ